MSKILIIEDDIAIAEIERDYLEINGFEVKIETDGVSGMNTALKGGFQLVLLDLMLPEIDGFTVCRSLREHLDIPILMVTAKKEDIDKIRGLGLGADDYIVKPFSAGRTCCKSTGTYCNLQQTERRHTGDSAGNNSRCDPYQSEITSCICKGKGNQLEK